MNYALSLPFHGDTGAAFHLAEASLTAVGFRITERTADSLKMVGPGMNSSRESALVGASHIHLLSGSGKLGLDADLGGAVRLSRFATLFPIGLVLGLGVVLTATLGGPLDAKSWMIAVTAFVGGNVLMWLFLGQFISRWIQRRTCRGLESLLTNMVAVGESAE